MNSYKYDLLWDGYGLHNHHSGIYRHVESLKPFFPDAKIIPNAVKLKIIANFRLGKFLVPRKYTKPTIVHGFCNLNMPIFHPALKSSPYLKFVLTVHDMIPLIGDVRFFSRKQFSFLFRKALLYADHIIFVSNWTKQTVCEYEPQVESKSSVIPNGFGSYVGRKNQNNSEMLNLISVSRYEPYKNFEWLFDLTRESGHILNLVTDEKGCRVAGELADDLLDEGRLRLFSGVGEGELANIYQNSDVFVHASDYEGFCLPAAEAIRYGLPLVYFKGSGIDDVAGGVVSIGMDDNTSLNDWVKAVKSASKIQDESSFKEYIAEKKSWKDCSEEIKSIYSTLC